MFYLDVKIQVTTSKIWKLNATFTIVSEKGWPLLKLLSKYNFEGFVSVVN